MSISRSRFLRRVARWARGFLGPTAAVVVLGGCTAAGPVAASASPSSVATAAASATAAVGSNPAGQCVTRSFPHPTNVTVLFQPFDQQRRIGARLGDDELRRFVERHALSFVELNGATNTYVFRISGDRAVALQAIRSDQQVSRAEEIFVTECAAQ